MSLFLDISAKFLPVCGLALALLVPLGSAQALSFKVLHHFQGTPDGADPYSSLIPDSAGNLYGTTEKGGAQPCDCGTVFKLAPDGTETVLHSFSGGRRGSEPIGGLIIDGGGNLYGTTISGGKMDYGCSSDGGCGIVFKLAPDGTETVLYAFCHQNKCPDGAFPFAGVIADSAGNLYGTTEAGGTGCGGGGCGAGTVFKRAPDGTETVLYSFCSQASCTDGALPFAGLVADKRGNLYGTTVAGGTPCGGNGCGVVFEVTQNGSEKVLHTFNLERGDGANPSASLILRKGNLYGTTSAGGSSGLGIVFKVARDGTETVLHSFASGSDGAQPAAGVVADRQGDLYGTTQLGGGSTGCGGCGTVFKVAPNGTETVLHAFEGTIDGSSPSAGLILLNGKLYGTAMTGGANGFGTVFTLRK